MSYEIIRGAGVLCERLCRPRTGPQACLSPFPALEAVLALFFILSWTPT